MRNDKMDGGMNIDGLVSSGVSVLNTNSRPGPKLTQKESPDWNESGLFFLREFRAGRVAKLRFVPSYSKLTRLTKMDENSPSMFVPSSILSLRITSRV